MSLKQKIYHNVIPHKFLTKCGIQIVPFCGDTFRDMPAHYKSIYQRVKPYTMVSEINIYTLLRMVDHIEENEVLGDIVECGVWRGGCMMAVALRLLEHHKNTNRVFYLFDTYAGLPQPVEKAGVFANNEYKKYKTTPEGSNWCYSSEAEVIKNIKLTGYPIEKFNFIKGKVEETLMKPGIKPDFISLMRLDTDWYESTKVELEQLYPRLRRHGVMFIDDYGCWEGSRKATDEYFAEEPFGKPLFHRVDHSCIYIIG